jgi:hypothetical protein
MNLLYLTGMTPPTSSAIFSKTGMARSKCCLGWSHQPPSEPDGQKLVAVTTTEGAPSQYLEPLESQASSKHAPHVRPELKSAWLSAAVLVP